MRSPTAEDAGFDPWDADFLADPYPVYAVMRSFGVPCWSETLNLWMVADHANCSQLLRAPALERSFEERAPASEWDAFNWLNAEGMLDIEGPRHDRIRRWLSPAFTRSGLDRIRDRVEEACRTVVDAAVEQAHDTGHLDLVTDVFEPLPAVVICQVLGIDEGLGPRFREWSIAFVRMFEYALSDEDRRMGIDAARSLAATMGDLIDSGHARPGSLLEELGHRRGGGELTDREAIANAVLLFNGGTGAVVNGLGNGFVQLLTRPQEFRKALDAENPALVAEEFLRFESPLQAFERVVRAPIRVGTMEFEPGDRVCLLLGSANRDPAAFRDPDDFNVSRSAGPTLTFGAGAHFCLGAPLARLELASLVPMLLEAMPGLTLSAPAQSDVSFVVRGYSSIPVIST